MGDTSGVVLIIKAFTAPKEDEPMTDEAVRDALRQVYDPEIGINIVDLGLVYRIERAPGRLDVALTLSTPSCPLAELIVEQASEALRAAFPETIVAVELVWDPPWTPERMSEAARAMLR
jgi:metal-sulfur cluster biosynthetic enzyme